MRRLSEIEGRVVGSLVEKQLATPQYYPLTLSALLAACNQATNRDPVTAYEEGEVLDAVASLKEARLVRTVLPTHGRSAVRYRHVLDETLGLDAPQLAVLAVLVLRGPQTAAELRARTDRLVHVDSIDHELELLTGADDPLVARQGRQPGQKEERWATLLCEPAASGASPGAPSRAGAHAGSPVPSGSRPASPDADLDELRAEVADVRAGLEELRGGLGELRAALIELRTSLGD